jgi:hypothetical protein
VPRASRTPGPLRVPGQPAAPDGPVDLATMYLVHRGFRRDLASFAAAVPRTPVADRATWTRLSRRFALFADVLHEHHAGEDAGLWPLLGERGADPAALAALEAEHALIDPLLAACAAGLDALAAGPGEPDGHQRLCATVADPQTTPGAHLAHEERVGMVLVQEHLEQADWDRVDRDHLAAQYRPRDLPAALGWVMAGLPSGAERALTVTHPAVLTAGRLLGRLRRRSDARTFGAGR